MGTDVWQMLDTLDWALHHAPRRRWWGREAPVLVLRGPQIVLGEQGVPVGQDDQGRAVWAFTAGQCGRMRQRILDAARDDLDK